VVVAKPVVAMDANGVRRKVADAVKPVAAKAAAKETVPDVVADAVMETGIAASPRHPPAPIAKRQPHVHRREKGAVANDRPASVKPRILVNPEKQRSPGRDADRGNRGSHANRVSLVNQEKRRGIRNATLSYHPSKAV